MIAQAFIGSEWTNRGPWTLMDETQILGGPTQSHLRYDLENGIEHGITRAEQLLDKHRNRRTYLIGYQQDIFFKREVSEIQDFDFLSVTKLKSPDLLQHGAMIFFVRQTMPIGGKTHTPLQRNKMFLSLQEEAREIEMVIAERPRVQLYANQPGPMQQHQKERLEKIDEKFTRREVVLAYLDSLRKKASQHVSDLEVKIHEKVTSVHAFENVDLHLITSCTYTDVGVPPTYKCFECMATGLHHNEACFLYERFKRDERPVWSTTKFKVAWKPSDDSD